MKTHSLTFISGATKNLFGLIPRKDRLDIHRIDNPIKFSQFLLDLNLSLPVKQLVLMDGILGMEGDGPSFGNPIELKSVIISDDPMIADYFMAKIMGFKENEIPLFNLGYKIDFNLDGNYIDLIRECKKPKTYEYISPKATSKIASMIYGYFSKFIQPVPEVDKKKCIKCGVCAQRCPGSAIKLNPYPTFNREKCVLCFCCHELCPQGAIYLKKSIISKILRT